jgi:uncharacterized protein YqiB (DUF1249 family)
MQLPGGKHSLWLRQQPTLSDLATLCEENYQHLLNLMPQLRGLSGEHRSVSGQHQDLLLTILEQTPYTTLLRLTYHFPDDQAGSKDPDAVLRVYHDARQVEVEDLRQQSLPTHRLYEAPGLLNRWRLNLFVSKWLMFCLQQGHLFIDDVSSLEAPVCDMG